MEGFRTIADRTSRPHEERTHAVDDGISEVEVGRTFPGPVEDQQLSLDEQGLGHHGPCRLNDENSRGKAQNVRADSRDKN